MPTNTPPTRDYPRSNEPIAWSLFGAGGMVVAFITPALLVIATLLVPLGISKPQLLAYGQVLGLLQNPWAALALWIVIVLQLFHTAHRIYHGLHDLHIEANRQLMLWVFYGGATLMSLVTALLLFMTR
jgi:fumarate reductase subunit D